ncbi:Flagellar biosynthesis protein FlhA [Crateriforma conspicua]|uniref:Flagellar biosynthesis protein FlhA n=2 Tax=Planctomycetaceae TaxID=126 RepID=A0A5C6FQP6_9PLAN|nr:flagellar biosynthesis protein FlhA [Crateriforma conspicua]TWU65199.1 Flagellar biosynthesis protein FlhA [Crateriforma conspicua]
MQRLMRYRDLILPLGIIACLVVILVPLPPMLMDLLLAGNITIGVIVLLTTVYVATPLEFSIFPSLLLATTLARLVLNVATTRLILSGAEKNQMNAAGGVIQSFGEFVAGDRLEIGLIIFVIIVLIQFIVITKGATRISEVAARFALDGMPGRQMAIDADMNAGLIDEKEAQRRRQEINAQADFYGAMDGASKFVRGDAIAGIVITLVNVVGGLYIGTMRADMSFGQAAELFTKLTIGDGLVSQVPALLISLAAGLLVTRSAAKSSLPEQFLQQLFGNPKALMVAGAFLCLMIVTNLPALPMATLGFGCIGLAVVMNRHSHQAAEAKQAEMEAEKATPPPEKRPEDFLAVDPMEVAIGLGLLPLADPSRGGDLMQRITGIRHSIAGDIGVILPKVRVRDDMALGQMEYQIRIAGNSMATASLLPDHLLAIDSGQTTGTIEGEATRDPTFGEPAVWIDPMRREQAAIFGYTLVEPGAVLATHLQEIAKRHADELLSRDSTKHLIDELKEVAPAVVDELIPGVMKVSEVQQVLQQLLREDVPIRQLSLILETLGDFAGKTKDPTLLCEYVRHRLARTISSRYRDASGRLHVVTLDPEMEDRIAAGVEHNERGLFVRMSPEAVDLTCSRLQEAVKRLIGLGHHPVVLVSPRIRPGLRQITAVTIPRLRILSFNEITQDTQIESHGVVSDQASGKA